MFDNKGEGFLIIAEKKVLNKMQVFVVVILLMKKK